jgi:hypothetical protein
MNRTFLPEQTDGNLHATAGLGLYDIFPANDDWMDQLFFCTSDRFDHRVDLLPP